MAIRMGTKQHHFVLVHGAGHGAWCWYKIVAILEKGGHRVTTVDLASAGESTVLADDVASLEEYSRPLEELFKSFPDDEKVILVGHSLGGMTLTLISELFPKKISVAIYVAAFMPPNGEDYFALKATDPEFLPQVDDPELIFHSKEEGGPITSMEFPVERLKKSFYNKCSDEDFAFALSRIKKFPSLVHLFSAPHLTEENYGTVPRIHVLGLHDLAINVASCHTMIKRNPPKEAYELDCDHSLFFSGVDDTIKILQDAAAKYDA